VLALTAQSGRGEQANIFLHPITRRQRRHESRGRVAL